MIVTLKHREDELNQLQSHLKFHRSIHYCPNEILIEFRIYLILLYKFIEN